MTMGNGLPCVKCGTSAWYKSSHCKECGRAYQQTTGCKTRRQAHQQTPEYKARNRAYQQAYRQTPKGKEKTRARQKARRQTPEYKAKSKAYQQAYRQTPRGKEKTRAYRQTPEHREGMKIKNSRRRTRITAAGGSFSSSEWRELCRHYDHHCLRCGKQLPEEELSADHVIAVANGGTSDIENIQPLCQPCNSSKGAKNTDYRKHYNDEYGEPNFWWQSGLQL